MPDRRLRVTKPGHAERRVRKSELAAHIAAGWFPVWDQTLETVAQQVAVLQDAVVDLASNAASPGPPPESGGGAPGQDGKSAYELAVDAGFSGSLQEWLTSLEGPPGEDGTDSTVPGPPGNNGAPGPNLGRRVVVTSAALSANSAKTIPVSWPSAMPDASYAVTVSIEHATPQQFFCSVLPGSRTTAGCSVVVRSTSAVAAPGVNVHVIGLAG